MIMNVLLLGATGFSGKEVLKKLLHDGHQVTAITRNQHSLLLKHNNLLIIEGDILNADLINTALKNQDAVINCLGIGGKGNGKPNNLISNATKILVYAMEIQNVKRIIAMSNVGAGNSRQHQPWVFNRIILPYFMKWLKVIIDDKNIMEKIIMNSKLDWTIIRLPNIIDKKPKRTITDSINGKGLKMSITNIDLAHFLANQLNTNKWMHKAPSVSN